MTEPEVDDFILALIRHGTAEIERCATYDRGRKGVSPQYLATMLRDEMGIIQTGLYWPSCKVQDSLRRLMDAGHIVPAQWSPQGCGYLGIGATRPTVEHRPRALQLGAS